MPNVQNTGGDGHVKIKESMIKKAKVDRVLKRMNHDGEPVSFSEVRRRAGVSSWFLYYGMDGAIRQLIEEAQQREVQPPPMSLEALQVRLEALEHRVAMVELAHYRESASAETRCL